MRVLSSAMNSIRDQVARNEGVYLDAIQHRSSQAVADMVPTQPWFEAQEKIEQELYVEVLDGGSRVKLPAIRKEVLLFSFDRSRPEAADWARKEAAQLVTNVVEDQRTVIRGMVAQSLEGGMAPRDVARGLRNVIGLTQGQEGWVSNHYNRAVDSGLQRGLSVARATELAQRSTDRYHDRVFRYRTETIARTEIMRATHEGRREAWAQGIEGGWISVLAEKEWSAEAVACQICSPMDGIIVPINGSFSIGDPPAHPNCRCDVLLVDRPDRDLAALQPAQIDELIEEIVGTGIRPGMGDGTVIPEADFIAMQQSSAGPYMTGRAPDGAPLWDPVRARLHDEIVDRFVSRVPRSEKPTYNMMGGGPASGKSTMEKKVFGEARGQAVKIDPDEIKKLLPEYRDMVAAGDDNAAAFVHEESSYLGKRILKAAQERRQDIVFDGVGDGNPDSVLSRIATARANGYEVKGYYVTIPTDEAVARATARAARTGRVVPESTIRSQHAAVSRVLPEIAEEFDEVQLFDNTTTLKLIGEGSRGRFKVLDDEAYDSFLGKAADNGIR
jgi:predicted ABC-type ATPase